MNYIMTNFGEVFIDRQNIGTYNLQDAKEGSMIGDLESKNPEQQNRETREKLLDEISGEVRICKKCRLHEHARNGVPGEGAPNAKFFFIGEAPGAKEDIMGRPFVGQAGKLLDSLLAGVGIRREDVFIGNIVKHQPPNNRKPKPDEIAACTPYLEWQIRIIKPVIIITLGQFSTQYIFSKTGEEFKTITEASGKIYEKNLFGFPTRIMPTFHPASALYNPKYKIALKEHFERIKSGLE